VSGRVESIEGHERVPVGEGFEMALAPAGAAAGLEDFAKVGGGFMPATVPSTAASVLASHRQLSLDGPPRRLDAEDVLYRGPLKGGPAEKGERVVLALEGLATIADVFIDGERILSSRSMFLSHRVDVTEKLRAGSELALLFRGLDPILQVRRPRPRWRTPMVEHQQLRFVRTTLLGRTPGWSPPVAAVGPYRAIWLERRRGLTVESARLRAHFDGRDGHVDVEVVVGSAGESRVDRAVLTVTRGGHVFESQLERWGVTEDGHVKLVGSLVIRGASPWWPHTHGEPATYRASVLLSSGARAQRAELGAIGFRSVVLDCRDDELRFEVNGAPVFVRGAVWMPLDPLTLRSEREAYLAAVAQAKDAGMNMLRVSGTTVYEDEAFYDACDEAGILVWQDLMFANMDYPFDDPELGALATREAEEVMNRLGSRPSIGVICGSSEGEQQAAMWGAPREIWSPKLLAHDFAALARRLTPKTPYWPSSAHGGAFPHQNDRGTTSYYGVGAYLRPLEDARRSDVKLATECLAFSNVPCEATLLAMPGGDGIRAHHPVWKQRAPRDLGAGWDFEDVRDHYLSELFRVDPVALRARDHERYLALSRVVTGEVMSAVFDEWRRGRSRSSGGLVWFLRDLWAGAGWGVVDARGEPKAPWFYLRRAFRPLHLALSDEGTNGAFAHVVNETEQPFEGELEIVLLRDAETVVDRARCPILVEGRGFAEIPVASMFSALADTTYAYRFGPPALDVVWARLTAAGSSAPDREAFLFPVGRPVEARADLGLVGEASPRGDGSFDLRVRTRRLAFAVSIAADGLAPSDDFFHVGPGSEVHVVLTPRQGKSVKTLRCALSALNAATSVRVSLRAPASGSDIGG